MRRHIHFLKISGYSHQTNTIVRLSTSPLLWLCTQIKALWFTADYRPTSDINLLTSTVESAWWLFVLTVLRKSPELVTSYGRSPTLTVSVQAERPEHHLFWSTLTLSWFYPTAFWFWTMRLPSRATPPLAKGSDSAQISALWLGGTDSPGALFKLCPSWTKRLSIVPTRCWNYQRFFSLLHLCCKQIHLSFKFRLNSIIRVYR